jgi:hypothetical protein
MSNKDAIAKWTATIEAARKHPNGVTAYCRENGIVYNTYYGWFQRLKAQHPEWQQTLPNGRRRKRKSPQAMPTEFISVKVVPDEPKSVGTVAVEIHLSRGPVVVLPHGMSPQQLASFVLAMEVKGC